MLITLLINYHVRFVDGREIPFAASLMGWFDALGQGAHVLHVTLAIAEISLGLNEALLGVISLNHWHVIEGIGYTLYLLSIVKRERLSNCRSGLVVIMGVLRRQEPPIWGVARILVHWGDHFSLPEVLRHLHCLRVYWIIPLVTLCGHWGLGLGDTGAGAGHWLNTGDRWLLLNYLMLTHDRLLKGRAWLPLTLSWSSLFLDNRLCGDRILLDHF